MDEAKRAANLNRRKIDFADLLELFQSETAAGGADDRYNYGEDRLLTYGLLKGRIMTVIHTETEVDGDIVIRVISARKANKNEQEYYFKKIRD